MMAGKLKIYAVAVLLLLTLGSCSQMGSTSLRTDEGVVPFTGGEPIVLTAEQVYTAMLRAQFSHKQIVAFGPELRRAIAQTGGAQIRNERGVAAIFAVFDGDLYLTSATTKGFIMPLN